MTMRRCEGRSRTPVFAYSQKRFSHGLDEMNNNDNDNNDNAISMTDKTKYVDVNV